MTLIQLKFRNFEVKVLRWADTIWHLGQILQVVASDLELAVMFFHSQEFLDFFIYDFHYVLWYNFVLQLLQKLLDRFLLFIFFICKVFFETFINFFKFFLGFGLILLEVVLLL